MSYPVFQVPAGDVLPIMFSTFDGGTGASITMTGLAVTDIEIYKDGSTTQRASDAGYTLLDTDGIDFDSITGIHGFSIDTGDNTDSGFYTVGAWFTVVVSAVTVDAQTVSFIAAQFRIMASEASAGVPSVNTTHVSGTAQTANDNGADINAILVDTAEIGAAGAGLTVLATAAELAKVPKSDSTVTWNATALASINAQCDTALADYDAPTNTEMTAAFTEIKGATWATTDTLEAIRDRGDAAWTTADVSGLATSAALATVDSNVDAVLVDTSTTIPAQITALNNLSSADVNAACDTALADYDAPTNTEMVAAFTEIKGATWATTDTLENIRDEQVALDTVADAVKAKTDQLTFTVANVLNVGVYRINGVAITGDGSATPFGV